MLKLGQKFFDDRNCRYLTVNGVGCDPKVYSCIQEELVCDEQGNSDFDEHWEMTDTVLMKEGELIKMQEVTA